MNSKNSERLMCLKFGTKRLSSLRGAKWKPAREGDEAIPNAYGKSARLLGPAQCGNRDDGMIMYFAEQDIPNPAKQKAKQNYLSSLAAIDSADIGSSRNKLFTDAKTAYIDRFIAEKKLRVINEEIALLNLMIQTDTSA